MPSGTYTAVAVADVTNKAWTTSGGSSTHWNLHDEDISSPDTADHILATVINKNDKCEFSNNMPALCETITGVSFKVHGGATLADPDVSFQIKENDNTNIVGGFKRANMNTQGAFKTLTFDKLGDMTATRAQMAGFLCLLKSITAETGDPPDFEE